MVAEIQQLREQADELREKGLVQEAQELLVELYNRLQNSELDRGDLLEKATVALELGFSEEALHAAQSYLVQEPDHPQALLLLSNGLVQLQRITEATAILEHAREAALRDSSIDYNLASTYIMSGDFAAAAATARRGVQQHPGFHPNLKVLSTALTYLDQFEEALDVARQATLLAPEERWTWEILCATLYNLDCTNELINALHRYLQCDVVGPDALHWLKQFEGASVGLALQEYSHQLSIEGYFKTAVDLAQIAQQIIDEADDASLPQKGQCSHHAANLTMEVGYYTLALQYIDQGIGFFEQAGLAYRQELLSAQTLRARILSRLGQFSEAEAVTRQTLAQWNNSLEDATFHATTLHTLGDILRQRAEMLGESDILQEAESRLAESLELRQHLLSSSHAQLADSLRALALLRRSQGRYDAQQRLLQDASQIARMAHGENHPEVASFSIDLAVAALEEGRPWEALEQCKYAIDVYQMCQLEPLPCYSTILILQAAAHRVLGQIPEAQDLLEQTKHNLTQSSEETLPYRVQRMQQNDIFAQALNAFLSLQHEMAYVALQESNYSNAAHYLGLALRADPTHEKNLSLLKQLQHATPSIEDIQPPEGERADISLQAIQAYLCLQQNQCNEAFERIYKLHKALPYSGFDRWVMLWLQQDEVLQSVHVEWTLPFFASVLDQFPGLIVSDDAKHELITFADTVKKLLAAFPNNAEVASLASSYYRKIADLAPALDLAHTACRLKPTWRSAIVLALSYETLERWSDAISTYEVALSDCTDPVCISLDLGDLYRKLGRIEEAEEAYAVALKHNATHEKALSCFLFCKAQRSQSPQDLNAWEEHQQQNPENPWLPVLLNHNVETG